MNQRLLVFLVVFVVMNLVFIPLLSLYGLRVCPILSIPGFGFGCYYAATFIVFSGAINGALILAYQHGRRFFKFFGGAGSRLWSYTAAYLVATAVALILL